MRDKNQPGGVGGGGGRTATGSSCSAQGAIGLTLGAALLAHDVLLNLPGAPSHLCHKPLLEEPRTRTKLTSVPKENAVAVVGEPLEAARRMESPRGGGGGVGGGEVGEDVGKGGPVGGGWETRTAEKGWRR